MLNNPRRTPRSLPRILALGCLLLLAALPAHSETESAILHYLSTADLRGTQVSVCVMDVSNGLMLAEVEADRPMVPASNMKLVTTAAALDKLGPDFVFSTKLRLLGGSDAPAGDGLPALVVQGDGDPAFGSAKVLEPAGYSPEQLVGWWVDAIENTGFDQFGQLIIDDRIFEHGPDQRVHPTWPKRQLHRWYCAQVMGLNFFDNCFQVNASPTRRGQDARVSLYPFGPFVQTEMRLVTGQTDQWDIVTRPDANRIGFRGQLRNPQRQYVAMHDPAMVFGELLKNELSKRGIRVGQVLRPEGDQRLAQGRVLHQINTTLQAVLNRTNQDSMNNYAEALLKRTGHAETGAPGTFENGAAAVRTYLANTLSNPTLAASIRLVDGSGLSRENRVSARALVEILRAQAAGPNFRPYLASLARPEAQKSLQKRYDQGNAITGQLFAKTGTINHASTLSGYLVYNDPDRPEHARVIAFSILVNGHGLGSARNISAVRARAVKDELVKIIDRENVEMLQP